MSRVQYSWKRSDPNFTLRSPAGRKSEENEYHSHFNSEKMQIKFTYNVERRYFIFTSS